MEKGKRVRKGGVGGKTRKDTGQAKIKSDATSPIGRLEPAPRRSPCPCLPSHRASPSPSPPPFPLVVFLYGNDENQHPNQLLVRSAIVKDRTIEGNKPLSPPPTPCTFRSFIPRTVFEFPCLLNSSESHRTLKTGERGLPRQDTRSSEVGKNKTSVGVSLIPFVDIFCLKTGPVQV